MSMKRRDFLNSALVTAGGALVAAAKALSSCSQSLGATIVQAKQGKPKAVLAETGPQLAQCDKARAKLNTALERAG